MPNSVVSSQWLFENLNNPSLIILDASQPSNQAGKKSKFENLQIKGARYFDLKNTFSDANGEFPNTLPSQENFEKEVRKIGINKSSKIVVYDNLGIYTSPRVWWMFKAMGHDDVAVLDGGLPDWIDQGFETEKNLISKVESGNFEANFQSDLVVDYSFVLSNIKTENSLLIDARSHDRFNGTSPDPRKGLKSGHIENSINIPFETVLENGKFKPVVALNVVFEVVQNENRPLVFSCGSGITACIVMMAAEMVLQNKMAVYDGSWTEWAERQNLKEIS
ncbi:MAG: 3-mercaptopyruvate sulfurtransferase [Bacteroidota bacterium]|jgi:thiosulfate/3-mercaptopyruvate sulfurtransferase